MSDDVLCPDCDSPHHRRCPTRCPCGRRLMALPLICVRCRKDPRECACEVLTDEAPGQVSSCRYCGHGTHNADAVCGPCRTVAGRVQSWPCQGRSYGECQHESCRPKSGRVFTPTPREGCPERCYGHYAPCDHRTDSIACDACIQQRGKDGPIFCEVPDADR